MAVVPSTPWWLVVAQGAVAAGAGLVVLAQPGSDNLLVLLAALGVFWWLSAGLELVALYRDRTRWALRVASPAVQFWAGFSVFREPLWSTLLVPSTLVSSLGTLGFAIGIVQILGALLGGGQGAASIGFLNLLLGVILYACPLRALVPLAALWAVIAGIGALASGLRLRRPQAEARRELT